MEPRNHSQPCEEQANTPSETTALPQAAGQPEPRTGEEAAESHEPSTGAAGDEQEPDEHSQAVSEPDLAEVEARMRPGVMSPIGFLGPDESLKEAITRDAETVDRLGLSYDRLAGALESLLNQVLEMFRRPVPPEEIPRALARQTTFPNLKRPETIPHFDLQNMPNPQLGFLVGHLQVFVVSLKDMQGCPWGDNITGNTDFMIFNRETGESVTVPALMPHLIRAHHFFGGLDSPYRTEPERLATVLGLESG